MPYYAVAKGRTTGIYMSWPDCESQVKGFSGATFKKFDSVVAAKDFIVTEGSHEAPKATSSNAFQSSKSFQSSTSK